MELGNLQRVVPVKIQLVLKFDGVFRSIIHFYIVYLKAEFITICRIFRHPQRNFTHCGVYSYATVVYVSAILLFNFYFPLHKARKRRSKRSSTHRQLPWCPWATTTSHQVTYLLVCHFIKKKTMLAILPMPLTLAVGRPIFLRLHLDHCPVVAFSFITSDRT